jgi:hypothetical protein
MKRQRKDPSTEITTYISLGRRRRRTGWMRGRLGKTLTVDDAAGRSPAWVAFISPLVLILSRL